MTNLEFMQNLTTNNIKAIYLNCKTRENVNKCNSIQDALQYCTEVYFLLSEPDIKTQTFIRTNSSEEIIKKLTSKISMIPEDSLVNCLKYQENKLSIMSYLELEYSRYYKTTDKEYFKHLFTNHNRSLDLYKFKDKEQFSYYVMKAVNTDAAMQIMKDNIAMHCSISSTSFKLYGEYVDIGRALKDIYEFKNNENGPFYNFLVLEKYQRAIHDDKVEFKLSELTNGHDAKCTARFFMYDKDTNQFKEINMSDRASRKCEWNFYLNL